MAATIPLSDYLTGLWIIQPLLLLAIIWFPCIIILPINYFKSICDRIKNTIPGNRFAKYIDPDHESFELLCKIQTITRNSHLDPDGKIYQKLNREYFEALQKRQRNLLLMKNNPLNLINLFCITTVGVFIIFSIYLTSTHFVIELGIYLAALALLIKGLKYESNTGYFICLGGCFVFGAAVVFSQLQHYGSYNSRLLCALMGLVWMPIASIYQIRGLGFISVVSILGMIGLGII